VVYHRRAGGQSQVFRRCLKLEPKFRTRIQKNALAYAKRTISSAANGSDQLRRKRRISGPAPVSQLAVRFHAENRPIRCQSGGRETFARGCRLIDGEAERHPNRPSSPANGFAAIADRMRVAFCALFGQPAAR